MRAIRMHAYTSAGKQVSPVQWYKVNIIMLRGSDRDFNVMQISQEDKS